MRVELGTFWDTSFARLKVQAQAVEKLSRDNVIIERQIFIAASPETIFPFLIDPALMARRFGLKHTLGPRPGGVFRAQVGSDHVARGVFTEVVHTISEYSRGDSRIGKGGQVKFTRTLEIACLILTLLVDLGSSGRTQDDTNRSHLDAMPRDLEVKLALSALPP